MMHLLTSPSLYIALQRIVGADRLRLDCIAALDLSPGDTVVDVGCGPAYYLDQIPAGVHYVGFDTSERYIAWARERWGLSFSFHHGVFDSTRATEVGPVDSALLLGVLHHLDDRESRQLLTDLAYCLRPGGKIVAVDTCFSDGQSRASRWMGEHDRGDHVRTGPEFEALATPVLSVRESSLLPNSTRLPGSYWMMTLELPNGIDQAGDGI